MRPLEGLRVLDLTRVLAGPFCTAMLADLGAEVIKLEPPHGDDYRAIGPFREGESGLFHLVNRGKRSIVLDLKSAEGRALAQQIAAGCDVVVENFRPGVAARLGLGAERLRAANRRLIHAAISGFGQSGPFTDLPAYDLVVQAMSGLMAATGEEGGGPLKTGEAMGDVLAGLMASWGILAALLQRERTGQGATLDVAMFDTLFALLPTSQALHLHAGLPVLRTGNRHPLSTPFGAFRTADGEAVIAVLGARAFAALCALIGAPEAASDPRFATDADRTAHEPELRALIEAWTAARPTEEVIAALRVAEIPTAPILTFAEAAETPHAAARGLVTALPHGRLRVVSVVGQPVRFDGEKPVATTAAPALGADTDAVLSDLGLTTVQIAGLRDAGILGGNHD